MTRCKYCNYKHTVILLWKFFFFFFQGYLDIKQDKVEPLTLVNHFLWLAKHNNLSIRVIC